MAHPELWLARHGQTDWSSAGKHTGRTDIPLNADGRAAAQKLGTILAGHDFELVLTSPLARARETCELAGFGESAEIDADLREWDYGDYEGLTTVQIREHRPGWTVFADGCPGGETLDAVAARADHVIERVRRVEGNALVFGHGHALRILAARWIDLEPAAGAHLALETATVSLIGWERETPAISRWNVSDGG